MARAGHVDDGALSATAPDFTKEYITGSLHTALSEPIQRLTIDLGDRAALAFAGLTSAWQGTFTEAITLVRFESVYTATGGTHSTSTVDLHDDGTTTLSTLCDVSGAAGVKTSVISAPTIAAGSVLEIDLAESGGSSPTLTNLFCNLEYRRTAVEFKSVTKAWQMTVDEAIKVLDFRVYYTATAGTHSTSTVDLLDDGSTILTTVADVSGATGVKAGVINTSLDDLAAGSVLSIDTAESGGTSPTLTNLCFSISYRTKVTGE